MRKPRAKYLVGAALVGSCVLGVVLQCPPTAVAQHGYPVLLQITSPPDGTVVHPGQTFTVNVAPLQGAKFRAVCVGGKRFQCLKTPPYRFQVTVPKERIAAGRRPFGAVGNQGPDRGVKSEPIMLDVEPAAPITRLRVEVRSITFTKPGERFPLHVFGDFADGSSMGISHSTRLTYTGGGPHLFTVDKDGWVTCAKNPYAAYATITVQYENMKAYVYVSTMHVPGARKAPVTPIPPGLKPPRPDHPKRTTAPDQRRQ